MSDRPSRKRGFTIVELLVVVGIIGILLAILAPALGGVKRRSLKFKETNSLREISKAWNLYGNSYNGSTLPGYLEPAMQLPSPGWNVEYEYHTPPPGLDSTIIPQSTAAPWTWRLLPYLDYVHEVVHGHLDEPEVDQSNMTEPAEALQIATEPGFGYNGYYLGGWWELTDINGTIVPRYRFFGATADLDKDGTIEEHELARVVVRSISQVRRSTEVVVFCSSSKVEPGVYKKWENDQPGSHIVVPPWLADEEQWGFPTGGGGDGFGQNNGGTRTSAGLGSIWTIEAFVETSVPIARFTKSTAVVYADGHTANQSARDLMDMRQWIDSADVKDYRHNP